MKRLTCCILILVGLAPVFAEETTIPSRVTVLPFKSVEKLRVKAYLLEEEVRTALSSTTNINLVLDFQLTNYRNVSDYQKYIQLNRLHGIITGDLLQKDGKTFLVIIAMDRNLNQTNYTREITGMDSTLKSVKTDFKAWAEKVFPRIPKVVYQEEVEKISIGKFSYTRPAIILEAGANYTGGKFMWNESAIQPVFGGYLDACFRYSWYGANLGFILLQNGFTAYGGPQFNLLQGLLTCTVSVGYHQFEFSGIDNEYGDAYTGFINDWFLGLAVLCHVSDKYQVELGASFTPGAFFGATTFQKHNSTDSAFQMPTSVMGATLKNYLGITPDIAITLTYRMEACFPAAEEYAGSPLFINSSLYAGVYWQFSLGGN